MARFTWLLPTVASLLVACGGDPQQERGDGMADDSALPNGDVAAQAPSDDALSDGAAGPDSAVTSDDAVIGLDLPKSDGQPAVAVQTLGDSRPADVYLPDDYDPARSWPLVILLHGLSATGELQDLYLGFSKQVSDLGFIGIVPDGTANSTGVHFWNASPALCCDFEGSGVDDAGYLLDLIDAARSAFNVGSDEVYLFGHSNGGFMAFKMACEHADVIAGVISLAGSTVPMINQCRPSTAVSVLQMHGTLDVVVPYGGGAQGPGAAEIVDRWASYDRCDEPPAEVGPFNHTTVIGSETTGRLWTGCDRGTRVGLWTLNGNGHAPIFLPDGVPAALRFLLDHPRSPNP